MSASQRAAAAAVAVLVVIAVAVLAIGAAGGPIGGGPDISPSPSAPPSVAASASAPPTAEPSPPPFDADDLLAELAEIEAEVEAIRGLPSADIGPPDLITRAELVDELRLLFEEDYPEEEQERDNRVLRALGLLGPDEDIAELQFELLRVQALGFYDRREKRMVVISDSGLDALAKITYAHEYTHALQDAAYDLASLDADVVGEDDQLLARLALTEGDATVVMLAWAFANLSQAELQDYALTEVPDTSGFPGWMVAQLLFPYETGLTWAGQLAGNPLAPDFGPIDAAFEEPPASTEQVMDESLQAWLDREPPIEVEGPDVATVLGEGWSEVETTTIGQATIEIMLEHFGLPTPDAAMAADGWGGDRAVVASGPDDAFAVGWRLAWDTPEDAAEFAEAYASVTDDLGFPVLVSDPEGAEVVVIHASNDEILRLLALELS